MPAEILVSKVQPRDARLYAKLFAHLDIGGAERGQPALEELRGRAVWEKRILAGEDRIYVARSVPENNVVGYLAIVGSSSDLEVSSRISPEQNEADVLAVLMGRAGLQQSVEVVESTS